MSHELPAEISLYSTLPARSLQAVAFVMYHVSVVMSV